MTTPPTVLGARRPRRWLPALALTVISLFTVAPLLAVVVLALSPEDAPTLPTRSPTH